MNDADKKEAIKAMQTAIKLISERPQDLTSAEHVLLYAMRLVQGDPRAFGKCATDGEMVPLSTYNLGLHLCAKHHAQWLINTSK